MSQFPEEIHTLELKDPEATTEFGRRLGKYLEPGMVVALVGPLGAGKTFLVRAIAEGMGLSNSHVVSSPTYVLIQEYSARLPIYHFDAYRLRNEAEFAALGVYEYFTDGVCLVEWADRVLGCLPPERLTVTLQMTGVSSRKVELVGTGPSTAAIVHQLRQSYVPLIQEIAGKRAN